MARAHFVKRANKNYPAHGIKKGESYYWWKFRYGGKRFSKTPPRRSQLTQSEFYSQMYDAEDQVADAASDFRNGKIDFEDFASALDDAASTVRQCGEDCEEKRGNMPDALQDSDTGQMLENRAEQCGTIADELESAASEIRNLDPGTDEEKEEAEAQKRMPKNEPEKRYNRAPNMASLWAQVMVTPQDRKGDPLPVEPAELEPEAPAEDEVSEDMEEAISHAEGISWDYE